MKDLPMPMRILITMIRSYLINHTFGDSLILSMYSRLKQRTGRPRPYEEELNLYGHFVFMRYTLPKLRIFLWINQKIRQQF